MNNIHIQEHNANAFVFEQAFLDLINIMQKELKDIKIVGSPNIIFVRNNQNVEIIFDFKLKEIKSWSKKIMEMKNYLELSINLLIGVKPYNIIMNFIGIY